MPNPRRPSPFFPPADGTSACAASSARFRAAHGAFRRGAGRRPPSSRATSPTRRSSRSRPRPTRRRPTSTRCPGSSTTGPTATWPEPGPLRLFASRRLLRHRPQPRPARTGTAGTRSASAPATATPRCAWPGDRRHGARRFPIECLELNHAMLDAAGAHARRGGRGRAACFPCRATSTSGGPGATTRSWPTSPCTTSPSWRPCSTRSAPHWPHGRFIVSDMIGRNGHMRWPEALAIVQEFWSRAAEGVPLQPRCSRATRNVRELGLLGRGLRGHPRAGHPAAAHGALLLRAVSRLRQPDRRVRRPRLRPQFRPRPGGTATSSTGSRPGTRWKYAPGA